MKNDVFTQESILKALIRFAIPGIITILMAELYNMVDTFFVGRNVGASAIGALSIAFPVQRMIIALSLMIGVGSATAISRAMGERDFEKVNRTIGSSITLGLVILGILPIVTYLFLNELLIALGARNEIFDLAASYIQIVVLGSLCLGFTNIFGYELTAMGHPKITLIATTIGTFINIAIDYLLVEQMHMGVEGAAIATVISQLMALLFTLIKMNQYKKQYHFKLKPLMDYSLMKYIVAIGFATFVVEISDAVLIATLNNVLLPIGGDDAVIIVGAITRVSMFMYITIIGISSGMQPLAAYNYGAANMEKLKKVVVETCKLVLISSVLLWACMMIFTDVMIGSFMEEVELLAQTASVFRFTIIVFPIISLYYVCIYYCQSVGKAKLGFWLSIYRQILLFIPLLFLLTRLMGMQGAWLTYPISDVISAVTGIYFLIKSVKELNSDEKHDKTVF